MAFERTLSIVKPDAVAGGVIGMILSRFEANDLQIEMLVMVNLTRKQAESFYEEHRGKDFFDGLVEFMISGPVVLVILRGEDAVLKNRQLMGATNPKDAVPGTLRADFGTEVPRNAVHGSDSLVSAEREINFFFKLES